MTKFKLKNTENLTTEDIKGNKLKIIDKENNITCFIGRLTHADKDYLYGECSFGELEFDLIDIDESFGEIKGEFNVKFPKNHIDN